MREAANAAQLKRNFAGSDLLYVPDVYFDFCRLEVMVMERIHGVPISDMERLRGVGTDIAKLAENGVRIFFTQVFRHNFFHADMHPGNIFVLLSDPRNPRYAAIDFGIMGTLDPSDQHYLAENFLAVFDRDYRRVALLHVESGWVPAEHPGGRDGIGGPHRARADLQPPAEGCFLRQHPGAAVRDLAPLQHGSAAAADPAAEDPAERGGAGPRSVPGAGYLADGEPHPAGVDA